MFKPEPSRVVAGVVGIRDYEGLATRGIRVMPASGSCQVSMTWTTNHYSTLGQSRWHKSWE